jgi:hypothetical protein
MDLTRDLERLASAPIRAAVEFCAVDLGTDLDAEDDAAAVIRDCTGRNSRAPGRVQLALMAQRPGEALTALARLTGQGLGRDRLDRAWKALRWLRDEGGCTELVLWLEQARRLSMLDQEDLGYLIGFCAQHLGLHVRLVYVLGAVPHWNQDRRAHELAPCRRSGRLFLGARVSARASTRTDDTERTEERLIRVA